MQTDDGLAGFIATTFVPGVDLYSLLHRIRHPNALRRAHETFADSDGDGGTSGCATITTSTALRWAHELASAIAHLHAHRILHRDIKETNVRATP